MVYNLVMVTSEILLLINMIIYKFWRALRGVASHPIHPPPPCISAWSYIVGSTTLSTCRDKINAN